MSAESKLASFQSAVVEHVEYFDKRYLRKMQKEMYKCSHDCCDNNIVSLEKMNGCVHRCSLNFTSTQNLVSSQFTAFQLRLRNCVNQCNDEARDKMGLHPSKTEVLAVTKAFDDCACACVDKHVDLLPEFAKRVEEMLILKAAGKEPLRSNI